MQKWAKITTKELLWGELQVLKQFHVFGSI